MEMYDTIKVIGKGSYGEVWLTKHKKDKKNYVLKKMNLRDSSKRERKAAEQEAKLLSKLRHPNIVSYRDSFETEEGYLYIAMGFCEGGDLYNRLKEQKGTALEERQVVEWFVQIAMALQYMHERNILHRDLKTQNIFLTKSKIIKLGDLGIARVLENSSDMANTLIGTPYYMSPELFSNKPYNHKSDVWALGCCVYEMATLKHAFNAKDMNSLVYKILRGKMPTMPKQYSPELLNLIKIMLDQNPSKRPSVNKILRDPYIKKNIAIFLEGTKKSRRPSSAGKRPSSGGTRPSSGDSQKRITDINSSQDSIVSSSIEEVSADQRDLHTIDESPKSTGVEVKSSAAPPSRRKERPVPSGEDKQKLRKKKTDESDGHERHSKNLKVKSVDKPRPLPPRPNSGTPKKRPGSGRQSSESAYSSSSTSISSSQDNNSTPDSETPRVSSARARRREQKMRESTEETPRSSQVLERRRKSADVDQVDSHRGLLKPPKKDVVRSASDSRLPDNSKQSRVGLKPHPHRQPSVDGDDSSSDSSESSIEDDSKKKRGDKEMNNFISLLDTTLRLNKDDDKSDDEVDEFDVPDRPKAPAPEPAIVRRASEPQFGISEATLSASGRLMDRINVLRRDCIRGLGVSKLKQAYDILDNIDEDEVEPKLVKLLGKDNFDMFAGKIWQLKFCEESAFGLN
ncbi:unnamed protein product [Owenia fusiformis]|uniref:Serine/threonine-protein kinase Nek4 n=1 Tax=Owenia fusiformis TaxID=6347 RepID=A0A8S4NQK4_OWEFU|nr:unnamed protein product [Owenia fusiformis]